MTQKGERVWNVGTLAADTQGGSHMQHEASVREAENLPDIAPKLLLKTMWPSLVRDPNPDVDEAPNLHLHDDCAGRGEGKG